LRLNEPITLRWIEPLHSASRHADLLVEAKARHASSFDFQFQWQRGCGYPHLYGRAAERQRGTCR
jgi:hypothetical protein